MCATARLKYPFHHHKCISHFAYPDSPFPPHHISFHCPAQSNCSQFPNPVNSTTLMSLKPVPYSPSFQAILQPLFLSPLGHKITSYSRNIKRIFKLCPQILQHAFFQMVGSHSFSLQCGLDLVTFSTKENVAEVMEISGLVSVSGVPL